MERHDRRVSVNDGFKQLDTTHAYDRKQKHGVKRVVTTAFLKSYRRDNLLEYPSGRGSSTEKALRLLPNALTKMEVYEKYILQWKKIYDAASEIVRHCSQAPGTLYYTVLRRCWDYEVSYLRIAKSGSDLCDLFTELKGRI